MGYHHAPVARSHVYHPAVRIAPQVRRAVRDGVIVAGLLFAGYLFFFVAPAAGTFGFDAYAYWALDLDDPYALTAGGLGAFTYTPVMARLFAPFSILTWPAFLVLWTALLAATVIWLGWRSAPAVLAFPPVALELYHGNVHLLIAAAIVLGFRYPAAWWFVLLTKVTPGIALLWFAVRREWHSFLLATVGAGAIVALSVAIDRRLWDGWLASVTATAGGSPLGQVSLDIPLALRLPAAAAIVSWGARTDRAWAVPVAATLGLPVLWPSGLAILAALWPIVQRRRQLVTAGPQSEGQSRPHGARSSGLEQPWDALPSGKRRGHDQDAQPQALERVGRDEQCGDERDLAPHHGHGRQQEQEPEDPQRR